MSTPPSSLTSVASPSAAPALDRRYVTAALMLVMFLAAMESTITSTSMATIIGDLHGVEHYSWVASLYLLVCAVTMPLYGRLADALGRKRVVLVAIGIFCGASLLASTAQTMGQLIVYRGLQGLGAGGIMPVTLTILGDIFTLKERARIQGVFSAVWGTSALAGPALGAFLVHTLGWRSIFFVNLPLGATAMAVLAWKYHDHEKPHSTDLDLPGVALLGGGCAALLTAASGVFRLPGLIVGVLIGTTMLAWFVRHERTAKNPIMPAGMLTDRRIGPALVAGFLMWAGFMSLDTFVPLYVQGGRGGGIGAAALVVTPVMFTWALSSLVAAPLIVRWGFRKTALAGSLLSTVGLTGLFVCAYFGAPQWMITATLAVTGLGFGPASMGYLLGAQHAVSWQRRGSVTSSLTLFRTVGGALGVGMLGGLFNMRIAPYRETLRTMGVAPEELLDSKALEKFPPEAMALVQHMIVTGMLWVFAAMAVFVFLQTLVTAASTDAKTPEHIDRAEAMEAMGG